MEVKSDTESGVTYIRVIPRAGQKGTVAYNLVIRPEALVADFNADDELVGVEVIDAKLMTEMGAAQIVAHARAQGPHLKRQQEPAPAAQPGGRPRTPRKDR
jgi:uncharacterized protein YuzE